MHGRCGLFVLVVALAGCNTYGYRFAAQPQPRDTPMYADAQLADETLRVSVDTHGRRLEHAAIVLADGSQLSATRIDYPDFRPEIIGGMSGQHNPSYTIDYAQGPTLLLFETRSPGPAPWHLQADILGVGTVNFMISP